MYVYVTWNFQNRNLHIEACETLSFFFFAVVAGQKKQTFSQLNLQKFAYAINNEEFVRRDTYTHTRTALHVTVCENEEWGADQRRRAAMKWHINKIRTKLKCKNYCSFLEMFVDCVVDHESVSCGTCTSNAHTHSIRLYKSNWVLSAWMSMNADAVPQLHSKQLWKSFCSCLAVCLDVVARRNENGDGAET